MRMLRLKKAIGSIGWNLGWGKKQNKSYFTLESGIDVGQGINVGPGKFVKKN